MEKAGLCFFKKGWLADAADIFSDAIASHTSRDDATAKKLLYHLARTREEQGQKKEALELYRRIARIDYTFGDVKTRIDRLRQSDHNAPEDREKIS